MAYFAGNEPKRIEIENMGNGLYPTSCFNIHDKRLGWIAALSAGEVVSHLKQYSNGKKPEILLRGFAPSHALIPQISGLGFSLSYK